MAKASIFGLVIQTVATKNLSSGCKAAALSLLATTIYGLVTPLFQELYKESAFTKSDKLFKICFSAIGACSIAMALGTSSKIMQFLPILALVHGIALALNKAEVNLNSCTIITILP